MGMAGALSILVSVGALLCRHPLQFRVIEGLIYDDEETGEGWGEAGMVSVSASTTNHPIPPNHSSALS